MNQITTAPAAWAAVIPTAAGVRCYGWGVTRADALAAARAQWQGVEAAMRRYMNDRLRLDPLTAEEASEVAEMLSTAWT